MSRNKYVICNFQIGMSEKYELKFDLNESQNELILSNEEEVAKLQNSWKQIISK